MSAAVETIVVGGGLAGLSCARALRDAGREVLVLEAEGSPGGRARTETVAGLPVDRGFQVAFPGYRQLALLLRRSGLPSGDLRRLFWGAEIALGGRVETLGGVPPRRGGLRGRDARIALRLVASAARHAPERNLVGNDDGITTDEYLRGLGFSDSALDGVLRPLFGGMFLDRDLAADAGYLRFLIGVMSRGPAVLPVEGLGQIAQWVAAGLRRDGAELRFGCMVEGVQLAPGGERAAGVVLKGGEVLEAEQVVLATPAPVTRDLLQPVDPGSARRLPSSSASMTSLAFRLSRSLYSGPSIILNGGRGEAGSPIDLVCQTSNITRAGDAGPFVLLASSVTTGLSELPTEANLVRGVGEFVESVSPGFSWSQDAELISVTHHPHAQYRPLPGVRRSLPGPRTAISNLTLAGDCVTHPSLEGAVVSGLAAARVVAAARPFQP